MPKALPLPPPPPAPYAAPSPPMPRYHPVPTAAPPPPPGCRSSRRPPRTRHPPTARCGPRGLPVDPAGGGERVEVERRDPRAPVREELLAAVEGRLRPGQVVERADAARIRLVRPDHVRHRRRSRAQPRRRAHGGEKEKSPFHAPPYMPDHPAQTHPKRGAEAGDADFAPRYQRLMSACRFTGSQPGRPHCSHQGVPAAGRM